MVPAANRLPVTGTLALAIAALVWVGCEDFDSTGPPNQVTISIDRDQEGMGTGRVVEARSSPRIDCRLGATTSEGRCSFSVAAVGPGNASLQAIPDPGSVVESWQGCTWRPEEGVCVVNWSGEVFWRSVRVRFGPAEVASSCQLPGPLNDTSGTGPPQPAEWEAAFGVNALRNGGFEEGPVALGSIPNRFGYWQGDLSSRVRAQQGIQPRSGEWMLHFIGSTPNGFGPTSGGEQLQLVDLGPLEPHISAGRVRVHASAWFNRVEGCPDRTDDGFGLWVVAMPGEPQEAAARFRAGSQAGTNGPVEGGWLGRATRSIRTDGDPATWEEVALTFDLPAGTTYLLVNLFAVENVNNAVVFPEFDGHYADDVRLVLECVGCP